MTLTGAVRHFRPVPLLVAIVALAAAAWGVWLQPGKVDYGTISWLDRCLRPIETNLPFGRFMSGSAAVLSRDGRFGFAALGRAIFRTDDGGRRWKLFHETMEDGPWKRIAMSSDGQRIVGIGLYSEILRTENGGVSWTIVKAVSGTGLHDVALSADGMRGLIVTLDRERRLLRTADGGQTWSAQRAEFGDVALSADGMRAIVVSDSTVARSSDGGVTWISQNLDWRLLDHATLSADGRIGIAVGSDGLIIRTEDGGATWVRQDSKTQRWLRGVAMSADSQRAVAIGREHGQESVATVTVDGGATWTAHPLPAQLQYYNGLAMSDDGLKGLVTSPGTPAVMYTNDGGRTWQAPNTPGRSAPYWAYGAAAVALGFIVAAFRRRVG